MDIFEAQKQIDSENKFKQRIDELTRLIEEANTAYHDNDTPIMEDPEYDQLKLELIKLERLYPQYKHLNSPTDKVGGGTKKGFRKVKHAQKMLSLDNAFANEDIVEFEKRIKRFLGLEEEYVMHYVAETKLDGLALSLTYMDGVLIQAATRGGGEEGEDVTNNVLTIRSIPTRLKSGLGLMEVRGEVFMEKDEFAELNKKQKELIKRIEDEGKKTSLKPYLNPRNAAAGSIRQLDREITRSRNLSFLAHGWGKLSTPLGNHLWDAMNNLESMGIPVIKDRKVCKGSKDLVAYYESVLHKRSDLPFDIDGVVFKVNDLSLQQRLGNSTTSPRWAIAYKLPPEKVWTTLEDIEIQVGRTGSLSPVGKLKKVMVGGVNVSSVTLHNEDFINGFDSKGDIIRDGKDIRIGDTVEVYRSGDVIPRIADVDISKRKRESPKFTFPDRCPVCNSEVVRPEGEAIHRCTGEYKCEAQVLGKLQYFVSIDGLNFDGLGTKMITQLYHRKFEGNGRRWLENPGDIFRLEKNLIANEIVLADEEHWGERSTQELFAEIERKRTVSLSKLLTALGIRHLGSKNSQHLADHYQTWDKFSEALSKASSREGESWDELTSIGGLGETIANSLIESFQNPVFQVWLDSLIPELAILDPQLSDQEATAISGKSLVFTGKLEKMTRKEAQIKAESLGARVYSAVSKNIDLVIAGPGSGSKSKKANELGVKVINEEDWLELIS